MKEDMSKEQTPIKDLEFYKSNAEEDYMNTPISVLRYITELENNTQAKVLEALEREVIKIAADLQYQMFIITSNPTTVGDLEYLKIEAFNRSKDYYETEVKPKYEKERKQRSN